MIYLIYLFIIPGLFFFFAYLKKKLAEDENSLLKKISLGLTLHPLIAIAAYFFHTLTDLGGMFFICLLSIFGWRKALGNFRWRWDYLIYFLGWPGLVLPTTFPDALNYQLRFPRDIFRFDLSVIDGVSLYHGHLNYHHLLVSTFCFSDEAGRAFAVSFQLACLIVLLILIEKHIKKHATLWKLVFLGIPLTMNLAQEPLMDILGILLATTIILLSTKPAYQNSFFFLGGLLFTFKSVIFAILLPFMAIGWLTQKDKVWNATLLLIPIGLHLMAQYALFGAAPFPWCFYFLEPSNYFYQALVVIKSIMDYEFHDPNKNILTAVHIIFYRVCPLLILALPLFFKKKKTIYLLLLSGILWFFLSPQERFFWYLLPVFFILIAQPKWSKVVMLSCWIICLVLLTKRAGLNYYKSYFTPAIEWVNLKDKPKTLFEDFRPYLEKKSCTYVESSYGWDLPGRVIAATPTQFDLDMEKSWFTQFRKGGVTHLLLFQDRTFKDNVMRAEDSKLHFFEDYLKLEMWRREKIDEVARKCQLIASDSTYNLFAMPSDLDLETK